jgi:uncharacterized protein YdeI (YjbR/CyaY-like superfamily)
MASVPRSLSDHPATWKFDYPIYHAETRKQWRAWLAANHDIAPGVWLCSWRAKTGKPACPYPDVVEEAICFGWIDSTVNLLDDDRGLQLLTPRKPKSTWTRLNRQRFADMEAVGLMTTLGTERSRLPEATVGGRSWTRSRTSSNPTTSPPRWTQTPPRVPRGMDSLRAHARQCCGG